MRNRVAIGILALMLACALIVSCGKGGTDPTKVLPEDTKLVVVIPSIGDTTAHFGEFFGWLSKQVPMLAMFQQQANAMAGGDFTNPEELSKNGINPKGGVAVALIDMMQQKYVVLVPVKKEQDFIAFLKKTVGRGMDIPKTDDEYNIAGNTMVIKKGFAYIAPNRATIDELLESKGNSISSNADFKTVWKNLGDGDIMLYMSAEMLKAAPTPEARELAKLTKNFKAFGACLNMGESKLSAKIFTSVDNTDEMEKMMSSPGEDSMLEMLPGPTPILGKARLSVPELWAYVKANYIEADPEVKAEYEKSVAQAKVALGMDIETDMIANIVGDPVIAYYGMTGRRKDTPDIVVAMVVKDEAKVRTAIEKLGEMMSGGKKKKSALESMGVVEFAKSRSEKFYATVVRSNLIFTTDADTMKKVLGMLAGTSSDPKAIDSVEYEEAKKMLLDKKLNVVYLGTREMVKVLKESMNKRKQAEMDSYLAQAPGLVDSYLILKAELVSDGFMEELSLNFGE